MRKKMLAQGYHVAPFFAPSGRLVLLAIDYGGRLLGMVEVARVSGRRDGLNDAAQFRAPLGLFNERLLWGRGVHVAPWWERPDATTLVAVNAEGRLVGTMTANSPDEVRGAWQDLAAVLDAQAEPASA